MMFFFFLLVVYRFLSLSSFFTSAWASVLSLVLNKQEGYTDSMSLGRIFESTSWIGFVSTVLGFIVAWMAGPLADW